MTHVPNKVLDGDGEDWVGVAHLTLRKTLQGRTWCLSLFFITKLREVKKFAQSKSARR